MCGLAGFLKPGGFAAVSAQPLAVAMAGALAHRGPDDADIWMDVAAGVALTHRRLAVVDLSPAGHQPMVSASGRYVLVFNGEIYNHLSLRHQLEGAPGLAPWRGHSDTESLLAGFECWGIEATLQQSVGMFAFALWDRQTRVLTLARDRVGEKPLYYGWQGDALLFGSELKALRVHPSFIGEIDRSALATYLRRGFIGAPHSIYQGILKLLPGTLVQIGLNTAPGALPQPRAYWSLLEVARQGMSQPFSGDDDEAREELESVLRRAVREQSIADVPLGAFLSGGIDSTTVVALLQAQSSRPVKTFTIGFHESVYQEAQHAASVARCLGTDHTEIYLTPRETIEIVPRLPAMYDEPFGDSSAIPTHLVSRFAREHVTVCLSGDGGDELFGGYSRYQSTQDAWHAMSRVPAFARRALSYACGTFARHGGRSRSAWKAERLAIYLSASNADECYAANVLQNNEGGPLVLHEGAVAGRSLYDRMMYVDSVTYLPDDILTKVDRAAMAVSLETRIPLLDHRVIELAWRLPLHMKVRGRETKWLLKRVLFRHVPEQLMERPKMGFGVPVNEWVLGPLRDWAEDLLAESRLRNEGFLNASRLRRQWQRHLEGASSEGDSLWQVLMFQAWLADSHRKQPINAGRAA
jgi:asparagine synthase (glutamine-hydrolysing)